MDQATESNQIFLDAWDLMGQGSPTFERHRGGLVERSWLGHSCPFFNLAVTSRPPSSPTEFRNSIQESSAWAAERGLPWILALCHQTLGDLLPTATALLPELGFAPMMPLTGMEAHQLENPVRDLPSVHRFTEAHASIGDHVMRLNEAAYQMKFGEPGSLATGRLSPVMGA